MWALGATCLATVQPAELKLNALRATRQEGACRQGQALKATKQQFASPSAAAAIEPKVPAFKTWREQLTETRAAFLRRVTPPALPASPEVGIVLSTPAPVVPAAKTWREELAEKRAAALARSTPALPAADEVPVAVRSAPKVLPPAPTDRSWRRTFNGRPAIPADPVPEPSVPVDDVTHEWEAASEEQEEEEMEVEEEAAPEVIEAPQVIEQTEQAVAVGVVVPTQGTPADALNTGRSPPPSPTPQAPAPVSPVEGSADDADATGIDLAVAEMIATAVAPTLKETDAAAFAIKVREAARAAKAIADAAKAAAIGDRAAKAAAVEAAVADAVSYFEQAFRDEEVAARAQQEGVAAAAVAAVAAPVASELNGDDAVGEWVPIRAATASAEGEATTRNADGGATSTETVAEVEVWYGSGI